MASPAFLATELCAKIRFIYANFCLRIKSIRFVMPSPRTASVKERFAAGIVRLKPIIDLSSLCTDLAIVGCLLGIIQSAH